MSGWGWVYPLGDIKEFIFEGEDKSFMALTRIK
jgi:hypothetical protein